MTPSMTIEDEKVEILGDAGANLGAAASGAGGALRLPYALRRGHFPPTAPAWLPFARRQLQAIKALPTGWDSHGAAPPVAAIVDVAHSLLDLLASKCRCKPQINPTRNGGVQFEWESAGRNLELDLIAPTQVHFFFQDLSRQEEREGTVNAGEPLNEIIELLRSIGC